MSVFRTSGKLVEQYTILKNNAKTLRSYLDSVLNKVEKYKEKSNLKDLIKREEFKLLIFYKELYEK